MRFSAIRFLTPILFCIFWDCIMVSAQEPDKRNYLDRARVFRKKTDAEGVLKLMADIEGDWVASRDERYYPLTLELCMAVSWWPARNPDRTNLLRKLATTALDAPGDIPIGSELRLLLFLQKDSDYSQGSIRGAEWEKERLIRVNRWLAAWQRFRLAKSKFPLIADAEKRDLDFMEPAFIGGAKRYVVNAYCSPPFRTEELEKIMEEYDMGNDVREEIVSEVRKRLSARFENHLMAASVFFAVPPLGLLIFMKRRARLTNKT
jgi:hypothetical protein